MPTALEITARPRRITAPEVACLGLPDLLGLSTLAVVLFVLAFIQSRHKIFWSDEMMGSYVLQAGSPSRFLELWRNGIDSSGLWFYLFAKPWEGLFGASELSQRLFSAFGIVIAAALIWITARRFYTTVVVAASVSLLFLDIGVLRWQLSNGRCYGVLMAAFALVLYLLVRGDEEPTRRPSPRFLVATFFAYNLLTGSHILGPLYAGACLAFQLGLDLLRRRFRPLLYSAAALGIVTIAIFSLPNLRSTAALGKPVFWTPRPHLDDLFFQSSRFRSYAELALLILVLCVMLHLRRRPARDGVYLLLIGFLCLDGLFFAISRVSTSIYIDRYMLPLVFGLILLSAECLTQIREDGAVPRWVRTAAPLALLLYAVCFATPIRSLPKLDRDYTSALLAFLPPGLPVVDTDAGTFVEVEHYHHGRFGRPFLFPLDTEVARDPANPGGVSGFNEMANFARLGIDAPDLQPTGSILARYPAFLVINDRPPSTWFQRRILNDPQFQIRDLGMFKQEDVVVHVWEVHRP